MTDDTRDALIDPHTLQDLLLAVASLSLQTFGTQSYAFAQMQVYELLGKARREADRPEEAR